MAARIGWRRQDVLAVPGPDYAGRRAWYDGIVAEPRVGEAHCSQRIGPVRCLLESQRDHRLAFAKQLDQDLGAWAEAFLVPVAAVEETRQVLSLAASRPERWQREKVLWQRWGSRYGVLREAVAELLGQGVRASSVIENLNSRLRNDFLLRRPRGADYLAWLPFFLNHRRFVRSEHAGRGGKSPAERWTGPSHPHGLELLGYTPFSRK